MAQTNLPQQAKSQSPNVRGNNLPESDISGAKAPAGASAAGAPSVAKTTPRKGSGRGFASMDAAKQREIASKGGKAAHKLGVAHEFTSQEAREAGRKGGEAVSQDTRHMAEIGARGGQKRGLKKKAANAASAIENSALTHSEGVASGLNQDLNNESEPTDQNQ